MMKQTDGNYENNSLQGKFNNQEQNFKYNNSNFISNSTIINFLCLLFTLLSEEQTGIPEKWTKWEIMAYPMNVIKSTENKQIIIMRGINVLSVLSLLTPPKQ